VGLVEATAHYGFYKSSETRSECDRVKNGETIDRGPADTTRAAHKLAEILRNLNYVLPARCRALDLGASPGGWTLTLTRLGASVVAVDPGDLSPMALVQGVVHIKKRIEHSLDAVACHAPFHVCVCDMNVDARDSSRMVIEHIARHLDPGALVVVTLKVFVHSQSTSVQNTCFEMFNTSGLFDCVNTEWLFSNGQERTLTAIRNAASPDANL
jgi:23S rRNA U2552 (ribose-2'-O)-methylase RlmE/FtsJ